MTADRLAAPCPACGQLTANPDDPIWQVDLSTCLKPNGSIPISLNDSGNHFALNQKRATVKARTRTALREADIPALAFIHVELHYRPKTNKHRDYDNIVATLKPIIDAMHQPDERSNWQPIVEGDDPRYVDWSRPVIHQARKGDPPALWVVLRGTPKETP